MLNYSFTTYMLRAINLPSKEKGGCGNKNSINVQWDQSDIERYASSQSLNQFSKLEEELKKL